MCMFCPVLSNQKAFSLTFCVFWIFVLVSFVEVFSSQLDWQREFNERSLLRFLTLDQGDTISLDTHVTRPYWPQNSALHGRKKIAQLVPRTGTYYKSSRTSETGQGSVTLNFTDLGEDLEADQGEHQEGGQGEQVWMRLVVHLFPLPRLCHSHPHLSLCLVVGRPGVLSRPYAASVPQPCDPVFRR